MTQLWAVFQNFHGGPEENWLNFRWYPGCNWNSSPPPRIHRRDASEWNMSL